MTTLDDLLNQMPDNVRAEIEMNAQKMISEYVLEQLYNALIEYEQGWQDATATKSPIPKPPKASLDISLSELKAYTERMGGTLQIGIMLPYKKQIIYTI